MEYKLFMESGDNKYYQVSLSPTESHIFKFKSIPSQEDIDTVGNKFLVERAKPTIEPKIYTSEQVTLLLKDNNIISKDSAAVTFEQVIADKKAAVSDGKSS